MLGWRWSIAAGIGVLAALAVVVVVFAGGGGAGPRPADGFRVGALHPGAPGGAGVAAGGVNQLEGANTHPLWSTETTEEADHELDLLKSAGADVVRIDLTWTSLETDGKGQYSPWYVDKADTFLRHAKERGIAVIATLVGTPCWASTARDDLKQGCAGDWWDRGVERYAPENPSDYGDIAGWVAARWGSELRAIEIWNEPNLSGDYGLHAPDPAAATAALIKAAYPPIKAAAPDVQVLAGALAYSDGDFLEKLYGAGIHGYFDGLSIHPYNAWQDPNDASVPEARPWTYLTGVPWIQSILALHGDGEKGLWLTELGWASCLPGGTDAWCVSDAQQAQYVGDAVRIAAGWPYVKAVVIYGLRNTGSDPNDRESQFGLVNQDFTLKPAYAAFQRALTGPLPSQGGTGTTGGAATSAGTTTSETPAQQRATPDLGTPPVTLPPEAAPLPFAVAVSPGRAAGARTVPVKIRCTPAAAKRCRGRLELRSPAKTLLASGTFDVARGVATTHAQLTKAGRVALARRRPPRLVATVTANGMQILRAALR